MGTSMTYELDDIYETLGLLYFGACADIKKRDMAAELNRLGIDGAAYYDRHFKVLDHYIDTFQKNRIATTADRYFFESGDHALFLILAATLCEHREWLEGVEQIDEGELHSHLIADIQGGPERKQGQSVETFSQMVDLLNEKSLSDGSKWKICMLLLHPKQYLGKLIEAMHKNTDAYRTAKETVQKQLDHLLRQYQDTMESGKDTSLKKIAEKLKPEARVTPSLITPLMVMLPTHQDCYFGLLHDRALRDTKNIVRLKNFCCYN